MSANTATNAASSEQKELLALFCSPHQGGNTGQLLRAFLDGLPACVKVTVYDAYRERPEPCVDCGYCAKRQGCAQRDLDKFMAAFERADYFVVAAPVYYNALPAPGKAVLDRFQRYFSARFSLGLRPPVQKPKRAALLLTCGSRETAGFAAVRGQMKRAFTVLHTFPVGCVFVKDTDQSPVDQAAFLRAKRLAHKLLCAGNNTERIDARKDDV